ncbi:MAG: hypothetical protein GYB41_00700 [Oceanospirillales bacterium]|nr:hypothetical protein [Oceanospirillales bacterium]
MQILGCDSGLSLNTEGQPICGSGWVAVDPASYSTPPLAPEDAAELWGWAVLTLSMAAAFRILKQQFFYG